MTLIELEEWMSKYEDNLYDEDYEYDDNGNENSYKIYDIEGKLYRIEFCNSSPGEKWVRSTGFLRDVYDPVEVKRKEEFITVSTYEEV